MEFEFVKAECITNNLPILFLHGWGGNKNSFLFLKSYFKDRDLWFISFPGHGGSAEPENITGIEGFAEYVLSFLNEHHIEKVDLVAHSFGGRVALVLLSKHANKFGKVVLTGCAGLKARFNIKIKLKILYFKIKKKLVKLKILPNTVLENSGSADYRALNDKMRNIFKLIINKDLKNYAHSIKNEVLLVWGECDTATPLYMGKKFNKIIKNSSLIVLKNDTHFCFYEEPLRFALILKYFFVY